MKKSKKSNYDSYFESLAFHLNKLRYPFTNSLDIEITKPDGYAKFTVIINLDNVAFQEIKDKPLFTIWSDWDPSNPLIPTSKRLPIAVEDLSVNDNVKIIATYENNSTNFYITDLDQDVKVIKIMFSSINLIIPVSENTPYNRYVIHLNINVSDCCNKPLLIRIIREVNMTTKFTKGNYSLAFPSRSLYEKRVTTIYFGLKNSYFLKLGISDGDIDKMTNGWVSLLQAGLIFIIVSLLLDLGNPSILETIGSITALAFPLTKDVSTYFHTTRLKYYTGKEDINRNLALASVASVGLGIIFVLLIYINFLRSLLLIVIMVMGATALLTAIFGLLAVRLGLLEKYICDVANCTAWIPIRYSAWNCHLSGRVMCKKCVREICDSCPVYLKTHCLTESDLTAIENDQLPCSILSSQSEGKIVQSEVKAPQRKMGE